MSNAYTQHTTVYARPGREEIFLESSRGFHAKVEGFIVGFLNTCGGVLHFGVRHNGRVVGVSCTRQEEDSYKLTVDNIVKLIQPKVSPSSYRLDFIPVVSTERKVIAVHVSAGPELLYMDGSKRSMMISSGKLYGPLIPQEIQRLVLHKYKKEIINAENLMKVITPHPRTRNKTKLKKKTSPAKNAATSTMSQGSQTESTTSTPQSSQRVEIPSTPPSVICEGIIINANVDSTIITISDSEDSGNISQTDNGTPVRNPSDLFASPECSTVKRVSKRGPDVLISPIRFPDMSDKLAGRNKKSRNS